MSDIINKVEDDEMPIIEDVPKNKEPKETEPHKGYGEGWRNKPLTDDELSDIKYFRNQGWCVTSIAMFLGLSKSTVEKYK